MASFADSIVSRYEGSNDEEEKEPASEAKAEHDNPGKMLAAAIRKGDSAAIEEAVCAIVDKHKY